MSDFRTIGFAGSRHPNHLRYGTPLLETWHNSETSVAIEIEAWQERMRRGEVSHVQLIDCRPGGSLTNLRVDSHTIVPWSWRKVF